MLGATRQLTAHSWFLCVVFLFAASWQKSIALLHSVLVRERRMELALTIDVLDRTVKRQQRILDLRRNK